MIEARKCTDEEKAKTPNMDYVIYFGGAKRLFTKNAIIELENELKKLRVADVIKSVCDCEIPKPIDAYHPIDKNICRDCNRKIEQTVS